MKADLEWVRTRMPVRIQFTCYNILVAEVIVAGTTEANRVTAAYLNLKYKLNKPMGGCISNRADLAKPFEGVAVGGTITE